MLFAPSWANCPKSGGLRVSSTPGAQSSRILLIFADGFERCNLSAWNGVE